MNQTIINLANETLQKYDFGEHITLSYSEDWQPSPKSNELICKVHLKFSTDDSDSEPNVGRFVIDVNPQNNKVIYASCSYDGHLIGTPIWEI